MDEPDGTDEPGVLLDGSQTQRVLHLLDTFEELLRDGELTDAQLELLTPAGTGQVEAAADLLMADVVRETADEVRRLAAS